MKAYSALAYKMGWTESDLLGCSILFLEALTEHTHEEQQRIKAEMRQIEKHGR